ncbi:choline ABC transporter ATP-binding protein [Oharaeibacter diazotrophicus]|uniref:Glycine betaine/proline transport system ATP-binding protein n=2 Tax=Oharaeibacter diazotrophicus TaxID=1920512 RepID=A0A4R6R9G4_9HYPH|nr:choline ABC transporter ATP-binding protein [Oharaeibacter diazotrophicus]TDP82564.1 glycine betaine/proline transport system ATP-binding protein [Oharaeibacter diazotrophicus]BBE72672.1 glycine betaine transport ATP-binding protein OpuAA [Pleomorphomonas sp. SM30]GLS76706.1 choline ABC transporter ATP-binding protein [Oharaeibacter diazotrophicus]
MTAARPAVRFDKVDIVFGEKPQKAFPLIDAGRSVAEINAETGQIVGVMDASFEVAEGEIVVLMGLSGSGKSTLIRAVNGLNKVSRGGVHVADGDGSVDVSKCDAGTLRRIRRSRVAMVFQQFGLLPWRTVAENVAFGLELSGVDKAESDRRVRHNLELVHLEKWAAKKVHELSGGMQQRVGLARAFATQAPILLMDEPFSALDPLIRDKLQDELLEFQRSLKKTILFVSHDLDEAMKIGNRIVIMAGGRVIQVGTAQDIMLNPATPYVAEFVAHMNPLSVLRACDLMRPLAGADGLAAHAGAIRLGEAAAEPGRPCLAPASLPVKAVMAARLTSGQPIFVEDAGAVVGIIDQEEILKGILRK